MSDLEIRMYAIVRTQVHPAIRIRWRGIGKCDWRNDLWPAHFDLGAYATMPISGQLLSSGKGEEKQDEAGLPPLGADGLGR